MSSDKLTAYFGKNISPNPLDKQVEGMWITKNEPHTVVRTWISEKERPRISEKPDNLQAYTTFEANNLYDFKQIK